MHFLRLFVFLLLSFTSNAIKPKKAGELSTEVTLSKDLKYEDVKITIQSKEDLPINLLQLGEIKSDVAIKNSKPRFWSPKCRTHTITGW